MKSYYSSVQYRPKNDIHSARVITTTILIASSSQTTTHLVTELWLAMQIEWIISCGIWSTDKIAMKTWSVTNSNSIVWSIDFDLFDKYN